MRSSTRVRAVVTVAVLTMAAPTAVVGEPSTYEFEGPVYDLAAGPDGSVLVGDNAGGTRAVRAIRDGQVSTVLEFASATELQGLASVGAGNLLMVTGGSDLAQDGELYRGSPGSVRMVADLAAFEREHDPDAFAGAQWKDQACEAIDGFSAGPQNNPFDVIPLSGGDVLVADAAGNTVLRATTRGTVDWHAILTPPVDDQGEFLTRWYAGEDEDIPCYVQPVPTSVAVGPNGDVYVGELTGALAEADGLPIGLSRVWRIRAGASGVVCSEVDPSPDCELLIDGLTSVIDLAFGPDGRLHVVELDGMSWIAMFVPGLPAGGTITSYDANGAAPAVVADGLEFPSAITFDTHGDLWVLEGTASGPTVRRLDMP